MERCTSNISFIFFSWNGLYCFTGFKAKIEKVLSEYVKIKTNCDHLSQLHYLFFVYYGFYFSLLSFNQNLKQTNNNMLRRLNYQKTIQKMTQSQTRHILYLGDPITAQGT